MGFIRGILAVILGTLLFASVFVGALLFTLSSSLKYENVKQNFGSVIKELVGQSELAYQLESRSSLMKSYCAKNQEYVFDYKNYSLIIPCAVVNQGTNAILDYGTQLTVQQTYYQNYNCGFLDCFKKQGIPIFLISEKAQNFWTGNFYLVLIFSVILTILMFFIFQKKSGLLIMLGSFFILISLIIWKIPSLIVNLFSSNFSGILGLFFSTSYSIFIRMLIIGIVLVIVGILFRIMGIGIRISNFISKIKENIAKEEKKAKKPAKKKK